MEDLFTAYNQDLSFKRLIRHNVSYNYPFREQELIKWQDYLEFSDISFNYSVEWTLDTLYLFKDKLLWENLRLKKISFAKIELLEELKPYLVKMGKYRKLDLLVESFFSLDLIQLDRLINIFGAHFVALSCTSDISIEVINRHKDRADFDWDFFSRKYKLDLISYTLFKDYWIEESILNNEHLFNDYDLFKVFSDKISKELTKKVNSSRLGLEFALKYPDHDYLNWDSISVSFFAFEYILIEPDLPYWNWRRIYSHLNFKQFVLLLPIIKKRDQEFERFLSFKSFSGFFFKRCLLNSDGFLLSSESVPWDFFDENIFRDENLFLITGKKVRIPDNIFRKFFNKNAILLLNKTDFIRFWRKQGSHLTIDFLEKNCEILKILTSYKNIVIENLPFDSLIKYPELNACINFVPLEESVAWSELINYFNSPVLYDKIVLNIRQKWFLSSAMPNFDNQLENIFNYIGRNK